PGVPSFPTRRSSDLVGDLLDEPAHRLDVLGVVRLILIDVDSGGRRRAFLARVCGSRAGSFLRLLVLIVLVGRRSMVLGRRSLVVGMSRRSFRGISGQLRRLFGETSASVFSRLLSIARKAKQPKVLRVVGTAVRDRDDMVDLGQSRIAIVPIILVDLDLDAAFLAHASVSFDDRHTESWRDAS